MNSNEYYDFEDRRYVSPTVSRDEQMDFLDRLRAIQTDNNLQISNQTRNLGTQIPSVKGGLTGAEGYFQSRYQTPQANATLANLKATAQADALNRVLANYSAQMQKRYNDAYKQYQKNQAGRAYPSNNNNNDITGGTETDSSEELEAQDIIGVNATELSKRYPGEILTTTGEQSYGNLDADGNPYRYTRDSKGNIVETNDPQYYRWSDGYYHMGSEKSTAELVTDALLRSGVSPFSPLSAFNILLNR